MATDQLAFQSGTVCHLKMETINNYFHYQHGSVKLKSTLKILSQSKFNQNCFSSC